MIRIKSNFSLYPWALLQEMPCGPGIHWDLLDREGNQREFFTKKTLLPGASLAELRYLMFLSQTDKRFQDENGRPHQISHAYYRGQKKIAGYDVDGYVETPAKTYLFEFNGCNFHRPCPNSGCKYNVEYDENKKHDYAWFQKEEKLREWCSDNNAELICTWECQINFRSLRNLQTPEFPRIMKPFETKDVHHIANLVLEGELFGFCEVTLKSPEWLIEKYRGLNFPPIIRKTTITADMVSPFMQERLTELNRDLPKAGQSTVVNAWNAEKIMLYTPMLKWLLELGVELLDVTDIVQYSRSTCFSQFINNCVTGRIEATAAGNSTAAQTFKICMNSS